MPVYKHITDYLQAHALNQPHKLALITETKKLTWGELNEHVVAAASYLAGYLPEGNQQQIVGIVMPNSWQYVVAYLAILELGHIAMPVDVIYKTLEIEAVLNQIPPALIITDQANKNRFTPTAAAVFAEDLPARPGNSTYKKLRYDTNKQIASLIFTSGTTGKPKAAPYTHANHVWNIDVCSRVWDWTTDDRLLVSLRLSHWYGLVMCLSGALYHGNTIYLQDGFDARQTLKLLSSGHISIFTHGPQAYSKLLEADQKNADLSKVRLLISGSGPLPPATWHKFKQVFGQEILEVYGSSETGRIASNSPIDKQPGSPGSLLPEVKIKLSADKEVLVKSPGIFPGYWKNPTLTRKSLVAGGYWRTGDIGQIENDRLILKGRKHEKIRKSGYSVSPRDVEWALLQNHQVKEVLVMGLKTPGSDSDQIVYFIVGQISEDSIKDYCANNLPSVWRADRIIKLKELPRSVNGKPQLAKLKALVEQNK